MSTRALVLLFLVGLSSADAAAVQANPIRKIVTLMQDMSKEIAAEGEKEKVLYDNFMCFCETGTADLAKTAEGAKAKIEELSSTLEQDSAEKASTDQELGEHKADREAATKDQAEAQALRTKEAGDYTATAAESKANIGALAGAIPALEKGMGAAALMQISGGNRLVKIVQGASVDSYDKNIVVAFLEQQEGGDYAPQSGQIVGIMKQMLEEMQAGSAEADSEEAKAAAAFADLTASKTKEVQVATAAIETKTVRSGELAVTTVQAQNALDDSEAELADAEKFAATLKVQCAEKTKEWQSRSALRAQEIAAISEAIAILNDDDALDIFKKAVPPAAAAFDQVGFLQARKSKGSKLAKAHAMIAGAAQVYRSQPLSLLSYSMGVQMKLKGKAQNFNMIMGMIDNMVKILGDEQADDDKHKVYCDAEFEKSADENQAAKDKMASQDATLTELSDGIATVAGDIATLTEQIKEMDKSVATATDGRKAEHAEYTESAQLNEAAAQLLEKAKQRLYKFYNPVLYKPPPKKELSMEDSLYVKGGREEFVDAAAFVQIRSHSRLQMPEAPETFSGVQAPKSEKSTGVIALMEMMQKDLAKDMADAKADEEMAQKEYEELMTDSAASRSQSAASITDKEASKAELETKLQETKEAKMLSVESLEDISLTVNHLHTSCDFILQNYDTRQEARTQEAESLKNSKSVLAGADLGF